MHTVGAVLLATALLSVPTTWACMRTGGGTPPVTTAVPPTTTTACMMMANMVLFFEQNDVELSPNVYGAVDPTGNCQTCTNGRDAYWPAAMSDTPHATEPLEAAGSLSAQDCPNMCTCDVNGACYMFTNPQSTITFWPYCAGGTCSMYGYLTGPSDNDGITPVSGGGMPYTAGNQVDPNTFDPKPVTDPSYPRLTNVGCSGCPVPACMQ